MGPQISSLFILSPVAVLSNVKRPSQRSAHLICIYTRIHPAHALIISAVNSLFLYPQRQQQNMYDDTQRPWLAGRQPMQSPMWSNDKPWLQRLGDNAVMAVEELKNAILNLIPSSKHKSHRSLNASPTNSSAGFIFMCGLWYTTSALSSNTGKAIMTQFRYPITLTFVQFGFVAAYCLLFMSPLVKFAGLRKPNREIFKSTFPMGLFQVVGHIFSSIAISRIPVSTVHTIKVSWIVTRVSDIANANVGAFTLVHRCSLCAPIRCQLFEQDVHLPPPVDHRCHAGMLI